MIIVVLCRTKGWDNGITVRKQDDYLLTYTKPHTKHSSYHSQKCK